VIARKCTEKVPESLKQRIFEALADETGKTGTGRPGNT
jgi:hypothetical protein